MSVQKMNFNSINGLLTSLTKVAIAKPYNIEKTSTFSTNDINDMLKSFELISEIVYESANSITTTFSSRDKSDISESVNTKSKINNPYDEEEEEEEEEEEKAAAVESFQQNYKNKKQKWKNYKCKETKTLVFDGKPDKSQIRCDENDKREKPTFTTVEISNRYVNPKKNKDKNNEDNENNSDTIFELYADNNDLKIIKKAKPKSKK